MNKLLLCLVLVVVVPGWLTYTDVANRYSIDYPKEWTKSTIPSGAPGVAFLTPKDGPNDVFQENVNVIVQDLSDQPMTLDEYTDLNKKQLVQLVGASALTSIQPTKLAGADAKVALYSMKYGAYTLKIKQYWTVKNKKAFVLTYTAFPDQYARYEGTATQLINSLRLN